MSVLHFPNTPFLRIFSEQVVFGVIFALALIIFVFLLAFYSDCVLKLNEIFAFVMNVLVDVRLFLTFITWRVFTAFVFCWFHWCVRTVPS